MTQATCQPTYLLTAAQMQAMDHQTIHGMGIPGRTLMETAGRSVAARCLQELAGHGGGGDNHVAGAAVVVACGTGNNGGDGLVAAQALAAAGCAVAVFAFGDQDRLKPDPAAVLSAVQAAGINVTFLGDDASLFVECLARAHLVVDALLGVGLASDVRAGAMRDAIEAMNAGGAPVVSVDIPSGVHTDTGAVLGVAVRASCTVTFACAKLGHYLYPGAAHRGRLYVADIGIPVGLADAAGAQAHLISAHHGPHLLPPRPADAHKGSCGHVVVMGGSPATPGAALLAARGALRAGAGLVSWATDEPTFARVRSWPAELMLRIRGDADSDDDAWAAQVFAGGVKALVMGPGLATDGAAGEALRRVLLAAPELPVCLDASALRLLAADPSLWDAVGAAGSGAAGGGGRGCVVTPHPGEMAALLGVATTAVQADRCAAARQLAADRGCVVVLKGAGTIVAQPDGSIALVRAGNPGMATAGTGDVLAGIVGAMLAAGLAPARAAECAVLLHGKAGDVAADLHSQAGLRASDVITAMGQVLRDWGR